MWKLALGLMLGLWTFATHATTYSFVGDFYTAPQPPFTTAMRVTGIFTTAAPLPPNMPLTAIGPEGTNLVTSWDFTDGMTRYRKSDSVVFGENPALSFEITTDANGDIDQYRIALLSPLPPHTLGQPVNAFLIAGGLSGGVAVANFELPCESTTVNNVCSLTLDDQVVGESGGIWRTMLPAAPVPTLTPWMVLMLMGLVALVAAYTRASVRPGTPAG